LLLVLGQQDRPSQFAALVDRVTRTAQPSSATVQATRDPASAEAVYALPLARGASVLGVLLVANSLREQVGLERSILWTGMTVAASGILLGVLLGWWVTER